MMCANKKGVSSRQVQRLLNRSMKTAWFLTHRIREAMRKGGFSPMGGADEVVEVDEHFTGRKEGTEVRRGYSHKNVVCRLFSVAAPSALFHVESTRKEHVLPIILKNIARDTHVMTDEANQYAQLRDGFRKHSAVDHGCEEYGYTDRRTGEKINTNTIEGFYSVFKRGMFGTYQQCSETHLHRCLSEFHFRYSHREKLGIDDTARVHRALLGVMGKRLTYETVGQSQEP